MKNKTAMRRIVSVALAGVLAFGTAVSTFAAEASKEEVIYVKMDHNGTVDSIYVVNSFDIDGDGNISDRGQYSTVRNLTTEDIIDTQDGTINISVTNAPNGKFYYEGILESRDIPWDIAVRYSLDGKLMNGEEVAGQSGTLQISVDIRQKQLANEIYRDHFAIQTIISLDTNNCKNILAPDATVANVGDKKQMTYIILPGKEKSFTVTADVTDFEMTGIQFNMIPMSISIDTPNTEPIKDKLFEFEDAVIRLDDGARDLDAGARKLDDGAWELQDGVIELQDGVITLRDGVDELGDGVTELTDGTRELWDGVLELQDGARDLNGGAYDLWRGINTLSKGTGDFGSGLGQLGQQSASLRTGSAEIGKGIDHLAQGVAGIDAASTTQMAQDAQTLKAGSQQYMDSLNELDSLIAHLKGMRDSLVAAQGFSVSSYDVPIPVAPPDTEQPADSPANEEGQQVPAPAGEVEAESAQPEQQPEETLIQNDDGDSSAESTDDEPHSETQNAGNAVMEEASIATPTSVYYSKTSATAQSMSLGTSSSVTFNQPFDATFSDAELQQQIAILNQTIATLEQLKVGYAPINTGVGQMADGVSTGVGSLPLLAGGISQLAQEYPVLQNGIAAYTGGVDTLNASYGEITKGVDKLEDGTEELRDGTNDLNDGAAKLRDGAGDLLDGVTRLSDGTVDLTDGVVELSDGVVELADGTRELRDGTNELRDGILEVADGTTEMRGEVGGLDNKVDDKVEEVLDEYRGGEFAPISFVDAGNESIHAVQFVMKTADITAEEEPDIIVEEPRPMTVWRRFKKLFPWIFGEIG